MINLIPEEIKFRHKNRSKLYSVTVLYIIIAAIFILGPLAITTYNYVLGAEAADYQSKIEQVNTQIGRSGDVSDKLAFLESRIASAAQFQEQRSWNDFLSVIAQSTPSTIVLTGIRLETAAETAELSMTVAGTTSDRRAIVLFRDKLAEGKTFASAAITSISETIIDVNKVFSFAISLGVGK